MKWIDRNGRVPPEGAMVLVFSPAYPEGHPMRYRTIDAQFFGITTEATHWAMLEGPAPEFACACGECTSTVSKAGDRCGLCEDLCS